MIWMSEGLSKGMMRWAWVAGERSGTSELQLLLD